MLFFFNFKTQTLFVTKSKINDVAIGINKKYKENKGRMVFNSQNIRI